MCERRLGHEGCAILGPIELPLLEREHDFNNPDAMRCSGMTIHN